MTLTNLPEKYRLTEKVLENPEIYINYIPREDVLGLLKDLDKAIGALKFYADPDIYEDQDNSCSDPDCCGGPNPYFPIENDAGTRAITVIKEITGE